MHGSQMTDLEAGLLFLFFASFFYRIGAANLEGFFNYPFWRDMGPMMSAEDFIKLRKDHIWKIYVLLVAPIILLFLVTVALTALGSARIPRWVFMGALACQLVALISTLVIQLPIQKRLDRDGFEQAALSRLIATDRWLRKLPSLIECVLVSIGLWIVITS